LGLVAVGLETQLMDRPGGIFVRSAEQISDEDRTLFQTVARVILSDSRGPWLNRSIGLPCPRARVPRLIPNRSPQDEAAVDVEPAQRDLILSNGIGGFTPDGREYVITTTPDQVTPAPWVNVLANAQFGSVISESGQAYTWGENAHEFRLTPWHNDPVTDASGEAFYLRDEHSGHFGRPRRCPGVARHPTSAGMALVTACSSTPRGASNLSCGSMWRSTPRSSLACSRCATCRIGRAAFRQPATWNGCWVTCRRDRPCT
jgi:cyclic beta-1,2-glucan synthetase